MVLKVILFITFSFSSIAFAEKLSEPEIFYRCYAHLTSKRLKRNHPLLKQIKRGTLKSEDACLLVLDKAKLQPNGRLKNINDVESKAVLLSMTKLHTTFFNNRSLKSPSTRFASAANDLYDEQSSALFLTKSLFTSQGVDSILKGFTDLEGVRSQGRVTARSPSGNFTPEQYTYVYRQGGSAIINWDVTYVQTGDLIGVINSRQVIIPSVRNNTLGGKNILGSFGGGLLGTKSYLKRSLSSNNPTVGYDGANNMNRVWSQNVLKDLLCKSLPAVRLTDGQPYKKKNADSSFRKSDGCIQCHVTMDQLAAGGRALQLENTTGGPSTTNAILRYPFQIKATKPNASHWPEKKDADYRLRPPNGVLYYRSYNGDLIKRNFANLNQLSGHISKTKDFYTCIAKRYYQHFTGVNASLADINDPFSSLILNEQDVFHRNKVIALGESLKNHKQTSKLIGEIFKSKAYQSEGFTLMEGN